LVDLFEQLKHFENLITYRGKNVSYHIITSPYLAWYSNMKSQQRWRQYLSVNCLSVRSF